MSDPAQAFPLAWPLGWRRARSRSDAKFNRKETQYQRYQDGSTTSRAVSRPLNISHAVDRVLGELERLGARMTDVVISTNIRPQLTGRLARETPENSDPGVAVYWRRPGEPQKCMAVDRYTRVADNLAAIAATLEAMRAIERHGGGEILERAFTGFAALAAPEQPWQVLGLATSTPTLAEVEEAYRRLAMKHHPDRGGSAGEMARINAARTALYERLGGRAP